MTKVKVSYGEMYSQLKDQISFLESSVKLFDIGNYSESKRIATTIRVLLHDTANSKSLLKLLHKKYEMFYFNVADKYDSHNIAGEFSLLDISLNSNYLGFLPRTHIDSKTPKITFDQWWEQIIISTSSQEFDGHVFSRKDIVLNLADTDGGAHVDEKLREDYYKLTRENSMGFFGNTNRNEVFNANNISSFSIRTIASELLCTLFIYFPDYPYSTIILSKQKPKPQFPNKLSNFKITIVDK